MQRDLFIVHTEADPYEAKLTNAIKRQLCYWGLSGWDYEDWEWETVRDSGGVWRHYGEIDQVDPARLVQGHPEPFFHEPRRAPNREELEFLFEQSGAIALIAPRTGHESSGVSIELDVLAQATHRPMFRVLWGERNKGFDVGFDESFFDYSMSSSFPENYRRPAETCARLGWLACMMRQLYQCGEMGRDVYRQLAGRNALLNRITRTRTVRIALAPDPLGPAVLAREAASKPCVSVLEHWLGGPAFTARHLATGNPPSDVIEASILIGRLLDGWCEQTVRRFPALGAPSASVSFALGAAKLRLAENLAAIEEFERALGARHAEPVTPFILLLRGLAWHELGHHESAFRDLDVLGWRDLPISHVLLAIFNGEHADIKPGELNEDGAHYARGRFLIDVVNVAKTRTTNAWRSINWLEFEEAVSRYKRM